MIKKFPYKCEPTDPKEAYKRLFELLKELAPQLYDKLVNDSLIAQGHLANPTNKKRRGFWYA